MGKNLARISEYWQRDYLTKRRWISYWYQINEVLEKKPKKILEIGIGNRIVSDFLIKNGLRVITCDLNEKLRPDFVADVRKLPFKKNQFDFVLCAQLLEHIPFADFKLALSNIYKVTRKWALITLPDFSITDIFIGFKILPFIPKWTKTIKIRLPLKHKFTGGHYWEIGKRGYSIAKIKEKIYEAGFKICKDYIFEENPYHHFFVLCKPPCQTESCFPNL